MLKLFSQHKKHFIFALIVILVGFLSGIIYYILLNEETKLNISYTIINYTNFKNNAIIKDLIIMSSLLVTSFFIIGLPLSIFYLFYEGLSYGFLISIFMHNFGISGLIYGSLFFVINEFLILLLIIFFIKKLINITRFIIGGIIYKGDYLIKNKLLNNIYNALYIIVFVLIINIILYFISPKIFDNLIFLLK